MKFFSKKKKENKKPERLHWSLQLIILLLIAFVIRTFLYGLYQVPTGSMETTILVGDRFLANKFTYFFVRSPERGEIIAFNNPTYPYSNNYMKNLFQRYVYGPDNWTKRVIGIPGDHVQGKIEDGKTAIYVNGKKLDEPYVNKYPLIYIWSKKPGEFFWNDTQQRQDLKSFDPNLTFEKQPFYRIDPEKIVRDANNLPRLEYPGTPFLDGRDEFDVTLGKNEYWAMGDNRLGSWDSRSWGKLDGKLIHGKIIYRLWSIDSTEGWWIVDLIKHPIDFFKRVRWGRCLQKVK